MPCTMKYIAEEDRKFVDQLSVKVYHSLEASSFSVIGGQFAQWIVIDHKIVLPNKEKIPDKHTTPRSMTMLVMLTGILYYSDSLGLSKRMHKDDVLVISNQSGLYQNILKNPSGHTDAEFIEITMPLSVESDNFSYLNRNKQNPKNILYNLLSEVVSQENRNSAIYSYRGDFDRDNHYHYVPKGKQSTLVFFVLKGEVWVNGLSMTTLDTFLTDQDTELKLDFTRATAFLLFDIHHT